MPKKVIVNSTPLIALSSIGKLHLLRDIYGTITIPNSVFEEISVKDDSICRETLLLNSDWIRVENIQNEMAKSMFQSNLHAGEVEVMILAKETDADLVIIDDLNAKKHAKYLKLNVTGTLGVILKAKQLGLVSNVKPLLYALKSNHIYISDKLILMCLKQAGELD
jgi:predicted nucleic acid-binding protein